MDLFKIAKENVEKKQKMTLGEMGTLGLGTAVVGRVGMAVGRDIGAVKANQFASRYNKGYEQASDMASKLKANKAYRPTMNENLKAFGDMWNKASKLHTPLNVPSAKAKALALKGFNKADLNKKILFEAQNLAKGKMQNYLTKGRAGGLLVGGLLGAGLTMKNIKNNREEMARIEAAKARAKARREAKKLASK